MLTAEAFTFPRGAEGLPALLEEFRSRDVESGYRVATLETPGGAWGWCGEACQAFRNFLLERSLQSDRIVLAGLPEFVVEARNRHWGPDGLGERDLYDLEVHYVVGVMGLLVDWTARQYRPDAPFPQVFTIKEAEQAGWWLYCRSDERSYREELRFARFLADKFVEVQGARQAKSCVQLHSGAIPTAQDSVQSTTVERRSE